MNLSLFVALCAHLNFGTTISKPTRVYGGLLHTMWRVDTDKASYAIKQLSTNIDLTNENIKKNYELSEQISSRFIEQGIPAICAIKKNGNYLTIIDGIGFLVYPWAEAKSIDKDAISEIHALKIAEVLAKMHSIYLDVPEITQAVADLHTEEKIVELIDQAARFNCPFVADLKKNQDTLLEANKAYKNALSALGGNVVVTHGDLDQKNVLWDKTDSPIVIDWESSSKINPTYDIINTAFYWSGIATNFNKELFIKMINAYQNAGGIIDKAILESAFNATFGWINWLIYNINRACLQQDSVQKALGVEQVTITLATIVRLKSVIPELIKILKD